MPASYDDELVLYRDKGTDSARKLLVAAAIGMMLAIAIVLFGKPLVGLLRKSALVPVSEERVFRKLQPVVEEVAELRQENSPIHSAAAKGEANSSKLQARHPDKVGTGIVSREGSQARLAGLPDAARISSR